MLAKNIKRCLNFLFLYLASSLIRLNIPVDHRHFGYNTKLEKKNWNFNVVVFSVSLPFFTTQVWQHLRWVQRESVCVLGCFGGKIIIIIMSWHVSACIINGIGIIVKSASNLQSFCFCLWSFSVKLWTLIEIKLFFHDRSWLVLLLILVFIYNMKLKEHPNKQAPQVMTLPFNGRLKIQTHTSWIAGSTKFLLFLEKPKFSQNISLKENCFV
jgi:hypothetical protein